MASDSPLPDEVQTILDEGKFDDLPEAMERLEVELAGKGSAEEWPWAIHVLGLARSGYVQSARFAYYRAPQSMRSDPELAAAWLLVRHLYRRNFGVRFIPFAGVFLSSFAITAPSERAYSAWSAPQSAIKTLEQGPWRSALSPLARDAIRVVREAAAHTLAASYSSVSAATAAVALHLPGEDAMAELQRFGWSRNPKTGLLTAPDPSGAASFSPSFRSLASAASRASLGPSRAASQLESS